MNWHKKLKDIYTKLEKSGYDTVMKDIHEGQLSGGTAGEIFSIVLSKLIDIKRYNPEVYDIIKSEIDDFILYAKSINYLSKDYEV